MELSYIRFFHDSARLMKANEFNVIFIHYNETKGLDLADKQKENVKNDIFLNKFWNNNQIID